MAVASSNGIVFRMESLPLLSALEPDWRELECRYPGSFFASWSWIGTWLKTLPRHVAPRLIRAERDAAVVGMAIAVLRETRHFGMLPVRRLHLNATGDPELDGIVIEHNDFVGEAGLLPRFVEWFSGAEGADELVIAGTAPQNAPEMRGLLRSARGSPAFAHELSGAAEPEAAMSRNTRQQLNRNFRALARFGALAVDEADTPETALAFFDALKSLHVRSWDRRGTRHAFARPFFETFHRALIASGGGQLLRVLAGDLILGYLYNFRHGQTVHAYQSGFSDEISEDRPGYVCHALAMTRSAMSGATRYDFLAGDNRLKRSFATSFYTLVWCTYSKRTPLFRFHAMARRIASRFRSH